MPTLNCNTINHILTVPHDVVTVKYESMTITKVTNQGDFTDNMELSLMSKPHL